MFTDLVIFAQGPDEVAFVAHLQGRRRDNDRIQQRCHFQACINKLVGEQRVVLVGEARFQFDGAGGGVDLVIQAQQ
ncbi:hypothetical protein D3C77_767380 [compost metagenome]